MTDHPFKSSYFFSIEEAVAAILEKTIDQKRPHKVVKSATDRYAVCCKDAGCLSNVCVRKRGGSLLLGI